MAFPAAMRRDDKTPTRISAMPVATSPALPPPPSILRAGGLAAVALAADRCCGQGQSSTKLYKPRDVVSCLPLSRSGPPPFRITTPAIKAG